MDEDCPYCRPTYAENLCGPEDSNVCKPCQELQSLEKRIEETRKLLHGLTIVHHMLKEQVNVIHDRFIRRLPVELSTYIFKLCIPVAESIEDFFNLNLTHVSRYTLSAPLILAAVCRRWRTLVFSTPQLWKNLHIYVSSEGKSSGRVAPLVEDWIARAGPLPLWINLCYKNGGDSPSIAVVEVLIQNSHLWERFKCSGTDSQIERLASRHLPQLRVLCLDPTDHYYNLSVNLYPERLRALKGYTIKPTKMMFDWRYLTKLNLQCTSAMALEALTRAPSLIECTFSTYDFYPSEALVGLPVHSQIQYLFISDTAYEHGTFYERLLPRLICPSLISLSIQFDYVPDDMDLNIDIMIDFIRTSGCALEIFILQYVELSPRHIAAICTALPSTLRHLHIDLPDCETTRSLFTHLAAFVTVDGIPQARCFPALRSLTFAESDIPLSEIGSRIADIASCGTSILCGNGTSTIPLMAYRQALQFITTCWLPRGEQRATFYNAIGRDTIEGILLLNQLGLQWTFELAVDFKEEDFLAPACAHFGLSCPALPPTRTPTARTD